MGFLLNTSFWLQILLVLLSVDVEINLGPICTTKASLSICHWNLNSISAHDYAKLSLLRHIAFHKFNSLSETYLNSSNSPDDETLEISGYNLVRSDHPLFTVNMEEFGFTIKINYTLTNYQHQLFIRMYKF